MLNKMWSCWDFQTKANTFFPSILQGHCQQRRAEMLNVAKLEIAAPLPTSFPSVNEDRMNS